jgi:hypothetical protein
MSERQQPVRQDGESVIALPTEAAPNPHAGMYIVVRLPEPLARANDGLEFHKLDTAAAGDPMELPRITVVFRSRQCDNENQAGVKGRY